jgi:hypothetical protein
MHVIFDTSNIAYDDYVQMGGGAEDGTILGENTYNYFKGSPPFQRGYGVQGGAGVGDVFRGIWRFFLPLIRRAGTTLSQEALNTGQRVLNRVVNEGDSLKNAVVSEGKKSVDNLLENAGLEKQFGTGKRSIKRKKNILPSHQTLIGHAVTKPLAKKRIRSDAFGLF